MTLNKGGRCYGYVWAQDLSGVNLCRIDNSQKWMEGAGKDGIDVIFIANRDKFGQVIVGWYKNATIYHKKYYKRLVKKGNGKWEMGDYLCEVDSDDAFLLPELQRTFKVPYAPVHGPGYPGNANIWYGDSGNENTVQLINNIRKYISKKHPKYLINSNRNKRPKGWLSKPDKNLIVRIEKAAVDKVWNYYENNGFVIENVQKDNCGWDLIATKGKDVLYLEIKGHMGNIIQFELSPNEFEKMKNMRHNYRVCLVRNALSTVDLEIFYPTKKKNLWTLESEDSKTTIQLTEKIAARAFEI